MDGQRKINRSVARLLLIFIMLLAGFQAKAWEQKQFIITFWCPPPATDEQLAAVAAQGYNLTASPEKGLDAVKRHGLKALLNEPLISPDSLDGGAKQAELDALIERVKTHPALEGYYLTDEPGSGAFAGLGRLAAHLRQRDPAHLSYINLFPTYANEKQLGVSADAAERAKVGIPLNFVGKGDPTKTVAAYEDYLRQFLEKVKPELISYDHYHFLKDGVDGGQYFLNLGLIRETALKAKLPFLNIIQASTIEPTWRLVNKDELRWLVYTTLAYGGKGISYFLYWGPKAYGGLYQDGVRTPLALDVAALNKELKAIGPVMMRLESAGAYHTTPLPVGALEIPKDSPVQLDGGEFVLGLFRTDASTRYFMVMNRNYKNKAVARVRLPDWVPVLREFDPEKGKWMDYWHAGSKKPVTVELAPGDGRLFWMVQSPPATPWHAEEKK